MRSAMLMHDYSQTPTATNTLLFFLVYKGTKKPLKIGPPFLSYLHWKTQVQKIYHRIEGLKISLAYNSPLVPCTILVSDMP